MVDVAEVIGGAAANWLAVHRQDLNARFRLAQRRFARLDAPATLALVREILPPLLSPDHPDPTTLLSTVYDLILLHSGRGTISPAGGAQSGISTLLRETFPKLRPLLQQDPARLPGALSNAVERMGDRGAAFAKDIGRIGASLKDAGELLSAGAVLAWRLGESRLRTKALEIGRALPPRALLLALGLDSWPDAIAAVVLATLATDAWRRPEATFSAKTVERVGSMDPPALADLTERVTAPPAAPARASSWRVVSRVGNFSGFGGQFDEPPSLLDAGELASRHKFWARASAGVFEIDADAFGWTCRPTTESFPVSTVTRRRGKIAGMLSRSQDRTAPVLYEDGAFEAAGESSRLPAFAHPTSVVMQNELFACTTAESFRIRILVPIWHPI
jgi:hypothetical protein